MKKYTVKEKIKNAKRWLNVLKTTKRRKTIFILRNENFKGDICYDPNIPKFSYCCLGVGCQVFRAKPDSWRDSSNKIFENKVGINSEKIKIIFDINDEQFETDKDFKNVRKEIIRRAYEIFEPKVAEAISKVKV